MFKNALRTFDAEILKIFENLQSQPNLYGGSLCKTRADYLFDVSEDRPQGVDQQASDNCGSTVHDQDWRFHCCSFARVTSQRKELQQEINNAC